MKFHKMRKYLFTLLMVFISLFATAQTIETTYSFSKPVVTKMMGYDQVQLKDCMQSALAGQPSLPWQRVSLMLPQGQEASSIEVTFSDFVELEGTYNLYPYQPALTYSNPERKEFVKDEALYNSKAMYPSESYGHLSTYYMNGIGFAFSAITPIQYQPATGKVRYATKATVKVTTCASKSNDLRQCWLTPNNRNRACALAQNPEMINSYDAKGRSISGYDLLIITKQTWQNSFNEYMDFYRARGLRCHLETIENIVSQMSGADSQEKIRNYIIQEYDQNGIMMVNLAGDVPDVPYRGFYCSVFTSGDWNTDSDIPADLYYAGLDGTWNTNNNNLWGEIGEDDLLPDVGIGRMCFTTQSELNNILHKTMTYQASPVLGEFRKITMGGEHLYDDPLSNGSQYLELLIGEHADNGYTTVCIPENYDFTRLYEEEGTWSGGNLRAAINAGTQYVHHDGHANTSYVAGWSNSDITNSNFSGANGVDHNYTFFHTSGCICGDFSSDCILERMTKIANFAAAVFGNSRYGWFNEGQTEGPAIHLHRETEDAYYHERIPYAGMALAEGKAQTAPWVNAPGQWEENALRWNFYDLNLLGDVAICPWHDEPFTPQVEHATEILVGSASTQVVVTNDSGDGLYNFRCSIYHGEDLIGFATTDSTGTADIEFQPAIDFVGELTMIITGPDALPQTITINTIPGDCAYVVYDSHSINDGASGNGHADFGESITLNMGFKNVGTLAANNVTATLTSDSPYITITDGTENISTINAQEILNVDNAFAMTVSDSVPNNTAALFNLTCTDGTNTWISKFHFNMFAPALAITGMVIDDSAGNNNGNVDPGETVTVHFTGINEGGCAAPSTTFAVFCSAPEITFGQNVFPIGTVNAGEEFNTDFTFTLSESATQGVAYEMILSAYSGNYITYGSFIFSVGDVVEDFETGDFSKFDWGSGSNTPWVIDNTNAYEGNYCAKSGAIGSNGTSMLCITLHVYSEGEISFYKKVSSESNYDKLHFLIDGSEKGVWSGEVAWSQETFALTAGEHVLSWTYTKDGSVDSGSDCAWLDNIVFPPTEIISNTQETDSEAVSVYPNPNNGDFSISLPDANCEVMVFNSLGQTVYHQSKVSGLTHVNISGLSNGVYTISVKSDTFSTTQKFVKR